MRDYPVVREPRRQTSIGRASPFSSTDPMERASAMSETAVASFLVSRISPLVRIGAQAGRDVGHRPDRGVVRALLEADLSECRKALGYADPDAERVAALAPDSVSAPTSQRIASASRIACAAASGTGRGR